MLNENTMENPDLHLQEGTMNKDPKIMDPSRS